MSMAYVGYRSDFEVTKNTPYLALMGELWSVFCVSILGKNDRVIKRFKCIIVYINLFPRKYVPLSEAKKRSLGGSFVKWRDRLYICLVFRLLSGPLVW